MERYSGTQAMEGFPVDPALEWTGHGEETGLEESMWQLGLGGGPQSYPEKPNEPDCIYYLRTGFCGFGDRCRFNHPRDRSAGTGELRAGDDTEYPERDGQPVCQYYVRTGMCKFGSSCKYHHPKHGIGSTAPVVLNFYGYPLRPGEKECLYYIKTGQCKFGVTCKFHHPQPAPPPGPGSFSASTAFPTSAAYPTLSSQSVQSYHQYDLIPNNWPVARPTILPGSYVPGSYGPMLYPTGVVPFPGWTPYPAPVNPVHSQSTQPIAGGGPIYGIPQLSPSAAAYTGTYITSSAAPSSSIQKIFPQRPGQPECQYYLRNGDCKFGPACKYHHPPDWNAPMTNFLLSPMGLPLRPGASLCSHYVQDGICRFGPSCKFDHPMRSLSYSPSASSLTDMPVAPYPVGYTNATLAPLSSSSNLRPEFLSGFPKDSFSPQMSSMNSSSGSVGSLLSKNETVPQSRAKQSAPDSTS